MHVIRDVCHMCRCAQGAKTALDALPTIWPPDAPAASAAALGQIKICGDGVSLKVQLPCLRSLWHCTLGSQIACPRNDAHAPHLALLHARAAPFSLCMAHEQGHSEAYFLMQCGCL